jgi:sigma-B regulation protein RsbU (phosphoserine phosphatase)
MVVRMSPEPDGFDRVSLASSLLTANLFGRATNNLLAAKRLREAHAQIDHELKRVAQLQRLLLPREFPRIPGVDVAASYSTAARAGGDYYDFFDLGDGRWGLWISDVSGHGALAAVVMAMLRTLLHSRCRCDASPGEVMAEINEHLSRESQRLPGLFVTAFYGIFDPRDGSLGYASAGHNPPLVVGRGSTVRQLDQSQSVPLAVLADADFETGVDRVAPGDTILLYTDGITEAMNTAGEMYGLDRLLSCVREDVPNAQHIVDCVTYKLMGFTGELPQSDDRTLVAMRIRD